MRVMIRLIQINTFIGCSLIITSVNFTLVNFIEHFYRKILDIKKTIQPI